MSGKKLFSVKRAMLWGVLAILGVAIGCGLATREKNGQALSADPNAAPLPAKPSARAPVPMPRPRLGASLKLEERKCKGTDGFVAFSCLKGPLRDEDSSGVIVGNVKHNTEGYDEITDNIFLAVKDKPLSTFSIDVDTASYANMRRMLNNGQLPPAGAVRIEELVNYFDYSYDPPTDDVPFGANVEVADCPWREGHQLVRVALKGKTVAAQERPACNLVFLLDVSGSMRTTNKLPLVKRSMKMLVDNMNPDDRIAIAVYAGASGLVLPSTPCSRKNEILGALDRLNAGGSTNGGAGIKLAYTTAQKNFIKGGINRVILCSDGDFNVGTTDHSSLVKLIEEKAKSGVFFSVFGFGMGNYKDDLLEKLSNKGNGNYGYIDTINEARKNLVTQMNGTLVTIAKDVKIQVEFNPLAVAEYRLIGYENRLLRDEDFNDDTKDAGEIGAGHTVTALYEIVPRGRETDGAAKVDPLKYQTDRNATYEAAYSGELLTIKLRYKEPDGDKSRLLSLPVANRAAAWQNASPEFHFAASVAAFGMILRQSEHKGTADYDAVLQWAQDGAERDPHGYRGEYLQLVRKARDLARES